ncbi:fungal-specific transcription factor domain-domain-containing protein [Clohesyomyces aquaticus]|uniref:Fungal-specific transcription factor domain-domain-containing protein n=1 Tax=Clohesyomyces aquaticus TaxID=1231657 RepID=A0A1Y1ZB63_9PLEO|nr:fungal-specific transcription factor domain-domain-containing protein [Clohesyomyces aquaticus]
MGDLVILSGRPTNGASADVDMPAPKRQCWECARRRLVCDYGTPSCKKCDKAGVTCPGYGDKKPLKWVGIGQVTSRPRRKKNQSSSCPEKKGVTTTPVTCETQSSNQGWEEEWWNPPTPSEKFLVDENVIAVRAVSYFNQQCLRDLMPVLEVVPDTPFLNPHPEDIIWVYSDTMRNILISLAIGHRIHSLMRNSTEYSVKDGWSRFYHFRGLAISHLSNEISVKGDQVTLSTFLEIWMMICLELRNCTSTWRYHADGINLLVKLRGGIRQLLDDQPIMKLIVLYYMIIIVIGNTTSPAWDQLDTSEEGFVDLLAEIYPQGFYPSLLCPTELFLNIFRINHLRAQAWNGVVLNGAAQSAAEELLGRIESFSPEEHAASQSCAYDEWVLIGRIYQAAVALYCISSLQSLLILPFSPELRIARIEKKATLFTLLKKALESRTVQICMLWPLIIAGAEARDGSADLRAIVCRGLDNHALYQGTMLPQLGKEILEQFWESGSMQWDECWSKPCVFVI